MARGGGVGKEEVRRADADPTARQTVEDTNQLWRLFVVAETDDADLHFGQEAPCRADAVGSQRGFASAKVLCTDQISDAALTSASLVTRPWQRA